MKNAVYSIGILAALLAVSCSIEENRIEYPDTDNCPKLKLTGYTYPETKVSIGEKDGEAYPLLWEAGDAVAIWSRNLTTTSSEEGEPVFNGNIAGEQAELYSGNAGQTSGVFQANNSFSVDSDEAIVITYPAASVKFTDGKISGTIPSIQEQRSGNSSIHLGNSAFAYAETMLKAGQTEDVSFTLRQKTAFVKAILSTSEFSEHKLVGAKLYSPGSILSGNVVYDLDNEAAGLSVSDASETVGAKLRKPVEFDGPRELYFTAVPCDLTGKDTYLIVTMEDDSKTVTIPAKINGGELRESCLSVITLSNISTSTNEYKWYDPVEVRDLVDGWAYGPQNTYFMEARPSGEGETSLRIDVRARGDFSKVKEPKYCGLITGSSSFGSRKSFHLADGINVYEEQPSTSVNSDYTVDIWCYDQSQNGYWGVVGIYDEDYNILWSYMISKYYTGDELKDVSYPGTDIVILDRILGCQQSNAMSEEKGTFDYNSWAWFQWGRKDPAMWSNSGKPNYTKSAPPAGADISVAISHPSVVYGYVSGTDGDWNFKEHRSDLWGGVNNTLDWYDPDASGHKTIYDPCPQGYRVPDPKVFAEVIKKCEIWEVPNSHSLQPSENIREDSPFRGSNTSVLAYPLGGGKYDYWPYAGARFGNQETNWGNRTSSNNRHGATYWSNGVNPKNTNQAIMLEYCYFSTAYNQGTRQTANRAQGFTVRCQKE